MLALFFSHVELGALSLMGIVLHAYRYAFGRTPLYMLLGMYFVLGMLADVPLLYDEGVQQEMLGGLGYGMIWLPFLLLLICIYELEGTKEAHRFLLGIFLVVVCFFMLVWVIVGNYNQENLRYYQDFSSFSNNFFIGQFDVNLLVNSCIHVLIYILVPVCFQGLRNIQMPYFISLYGSFSVFIVLNEAVLILHSFAHGGSYNLILVGEAEWFSRMTCIAWLSLLGHFYLAFNRSATVQNRRTWGFIVDIAGYFSNVSTMRKSLQEWEGRYQLVIDNSSDMIFILAEDGSLLNANPSALKLIGRLLGIRKFSVEDYVFDEEGRPYPWKKAWGEITSGSEENKVLLLKNFYLIVPGIQKMDVDISISAGAADYQTVAVVIVRDMTRQKEEEREKKAQLEQAMHSQRLESIGELAGGIAHDFNNLLHGIQANLEGLQTRWTFPEEPRAMLDNIDMASQRAAGLIEQLLGFARKGKFRDEVLDVPQLLEQTAKLFRPSAKGITFKVLTEPMPLIIRGDSMQLEQVLLNILINSRDALEHNAESKKIVLRAGEANENLPGWRQGPDKQASVQDYLCIRIKDNGCGMSPEVAEKIFDPFFTTKETGKGTGMGLAMAYGCIARHHGWIHVESAPEAGCEFLIFLRKYRSGEEKAAV